MKIKALVEKRNALQAEAKQLLEVCQTEVRALNEEEDAKFNELTEEVRALNETIEKMQKQSKNETVAVEAEERGKEMEKEKKELTLEDEVRALANFIKKENLEELRAMNLTSGANFVPTILHHDIVKKLEEVAPIWARVHKMTPESGTVELLKETNIGTAGFVGDMTNLNVNDFEVGKIELKQKRAGSAVELSQMLVNDSGIDVVGYATDVLTRRLGYALDRVMINGEVGSKQFEGLKNAPAACEVTSADTASLGIDDFINVVNAMHPDMQAGAVWIMSRKLFNQISLLKDGVGNYYLTRQLNVVTNKPEYRLLGHEILINDAVASEGTTGEKAAYLVNIGEAYAGMVKKNMEFKHVTGDTTQALRGSHLLMLDIYADAVIKNEQAIRVLKRK